MKVKNIKLSNIRRRIEISIFGLLLEMILFQKMKVINDAIFIPCIRSLFVSTKANRSSSLICNPSASFEIRIRAQASFPFFKTNIRCFVVYIFHLKKTVFFLSIFFAAFIFFIDVTSLTFFWLAMSHFINIIKLIGNLHKILVSVLILLSITHISGF